MVNRRGRRFTNEAANCNAFGFRIAAGGTGREVPAWVPRGDPPAELAETLGVDPDELERTVARSNEVSAAGHDPDFGRGDSAFDCWWGDPHPKSRRDATLGPLTRGPFYAFQIHSGCRGTKGGPRVDPTPGCSTSTVTRAPDCTPEEK